MLASKMRWEIQRPDQDKVKSLTEQLDITPLVASLLVKRGFDTAESARLFLNTKEADFYDPFEMKGMKEAVERIKQAISQQEPIMIYGDYDADGVTSTSVMLKTLQKLSAHVDFYIPDRFKEGYGPNEQAFRSIKEQGFSLIITVDTGIAAVHEAEAAKELGLDVIITDHHEPGPVLPDVCAIVHPKQPGCAYPFKELAGVGVAFKLAHALLGALPEDLLDLAAIGTIADLVPLHDENRLLATLGMQKLRMTNRPGLKALIKLSGGDIGQANEETIGFQLAPRLNAVGRIEQADPAVHLLMTEDEFEADELATEIDQLNKERQKIVSKMTDEAIEMVEQQGPNGSAIVVAKPGWNPGVVGIVASKLVDRFYRPAVVLGIDEEKGIAKGSARSIKGFDLFKSLSSCRDILPHFGGHPMAAGMTLHADDVSDLRDRLNQIADETLTEEDFIPVQEIDLVCSVEDITVESISEINLLSPFGMQNPKPHVMVENALLEDVRRIGANKNHIKMTVKDQSAKLDCVGFHKGELETGIVPGSRISLVGEMSINEWNNRKKPQLMIKDAAVSEWQLFDLRGKRTWEETIVALPSEKRVIVCFKEETKQLLQNEELRHQLHTVSSEQEARDLELDSAYVVFLDAPPSLDLLSSLVEGKRPERVYFIFMNNEEHFLSAFPTRDYFKWYYGFLLKRGTFDLKTHGSELAKHKGWTKDTINFMTKVFFDLGFVRIENGVLSVIYDVKKRDLTDSQTYQAKQQLMELDQKLNYSAAEELKEWLNKLMNQDSEAYESTRRT
ncbi:single-stranded-DNA-specific exonuclease RecJ [Bacillus sp. HU-1818]|uniref:single-stranded-DNA-specific exonuclease RecJ n=1 Tax=Bacillus sp. HU-1818 TaxID=2704469 RepID=UPI001F5DC6BA|nr:single-stranded-DNA-specific exonuclease RecJ [Bacillus sp. HU-1818]MCI3196368.1 single-stranded-DNA-specific exonuclease RecJ [Bacillus sp. HU-1818]